MRKPDLGSILLVVVFIVAIAVITYLAWINLSTSFASNTSDVLWYSQPTWSNPAPTPTPKPTEPTEETEESAEDSDEDSEE